MQCSYEEALQERVEEGDDGRTVRAALALGDLLVATHGGPPPLPAMLLWQCVATVGCRVCGSVCTGAEVVAAEFDVVPQWAFGCRLLDALCRGDPVAAERCDLRAMPRDVLAAVPHAVAHYADGSERDDVRAEVVHRAIHASAAAAVNNPDRPRATDIGARSSDGDAADDLPDASVSSWPEERCPEGVRQLMRFARKVPQPLCVAAARGASKHLLRALEPSIGRELSYDRRRCAIANAAAGDAVGAVSALVGDDAGLAHLAVLVCVHFGAVRCLEKLVTDFGAPAVAAAATALVEQDPTYVLLNFVVTRFARPFQLREPHWPPVLCALPAIPQAVPTLHFLKRCGAPKLSAVRVARLVEACNQLLLDEYDGRLVQLRPQHAAAAGSPPPPWEKRLGDYDVLGALTAALDVLGWEGDLAVAAEEVRGPADVGMRGLLAVLYDRGVRPTAAQVRFACADGDAARVVCVFSAAGPDGVDCRAGTFDATDCLVTLVRHAAATATTARERREPPPSEDPAQWAAAVAALVAAGAAPASPAGCSALHAAVSMDTPTVAEVLLDAGTPIDVPANDGCPLYHAVGVPANVAMLLRRGATVDARAWFGSTALGRACKTLASGVIGILLDHGASVDDVDRHGTCAEEYLLGWKRAADLEDVGVEDVLQRMHRARGVGVSSLLVTASRTLHAGAVRVVAGTLDAAQLAEVGATALLAACGSTRYAGEGRVLETMTALLDVVPPSAVHATDDRGCTPLHLLLDEASWYCDPSEPVGELLRRGADANAEDADGLTALEMHLSDVDRHGRSRGDLALGCVEVLLEHGARCRSPLALHAIVSKCIERHDARVAAVARQLIACGVPVDQRDADGRTAQQAARRRGLELTRNAIAGTNDEQCKAGSAPAAFSASSREHSLRGEGGSRCLAGAALRRRARPTFSSSSSDDDETGRTAAAPAPRRHRRETRR